MKGSDSGIRIAPITDDVLDLAWQLRLRALKENPEALGQPYDEAAAFSPAAVREVYGTFWTGGDNMVFVAVAAAGAIAGMTGLARSMRPKIHHRADIWGVYVAPEHRGQGISDRLLAAAIAYGRRLDGLLQLQLQVMSRNLAAIRSYERAGFVRWGTMPRSDIIDGVPLDSDFMLLMLDDGSGDLRNPLEGTIS